MVRRLSYGRMSGSPGGSLSYARAFRTHGSVLRFRRPSPAGCNGLHFYDPDMYNYARMTSGRA